uniref:NADH-ubiquinone oxidoreductase chain 6 n=1 Tax=Agrilinae sp. 1 ACP-2013 TaxID=1434404 RepID=A0A3G5FNV6_9COLE|nr:NADH dehydrogenase subunit 6 [Agrilinae sp. 1 ACP-2013]
MILLMISLTISVTFLFTKHPLSMGFNLLIQTIMISLITGLLNLNFWYPFILFLIMVGGMLIIFIYMTSVASNEKFNPSMMMTVALMTLIIITSVMLLFTEPMPLKESLLSTITQPENLKISWTMSLTKFITYPQNLKLIMMMSYLFLALVAVVKITNIKYGPLRMN